ncbi:MAG TPA: exo-alpha-sialidase [Thermoanaerobaculia bacterium]
MPARKIPPPAPLTVRNGDALLLVGTMKGLFVLRSDGKRRRWAMTGPFFPGSSVYAAAFDTRAGRHRLWAAPSSMHWGAELAWSDDFGKSWQRPAAPLVRFPEASGSALKNIWQITPGRADQPDTLYCGVEPSALFESRDAGQTWTLNDGLWNHPHRARWQPGGGGLCLHTVLVDPTREGRLTVASSTGGVYRSDDGGRTWQARNRGVRAEFLPDPHPEFGQCVHKIAHHAVRPGRLFLQNHWGLYRSDDGGDSWQDVAHGVPSDFGFCMGVHPRDPDTAFIVPLHSDGFRCTPEGKLRVYRTRDAGASWQAMTRGLPQKDALETVVRDGMAVDGFDPAGVYFGTRSGKVYGSPDDGRTWQLLRDGLPPVVCVKTAAAANLRARRRLSRAA